jgi:hypothetical protein
LYPEVDDSLPKITPGAAYFLSLATEARRAVIDIFGSPDKLLADHRNDVIAAVREVLGDYDTLAKLDETKAVAVVTKILPTLKLKLLRPADLDGWMSQQTGVATRFYKHRTVVDSTQVNARLDDLEKIFRDASQHLNDIPFVTDVDLKTIRERIEKTPDTHRFTVGFASLFGFPREMFADEDGFRQRVGRLAETLSGLNADYIEWFHKKAGAMAGEICFEGEVVWTVHPFARQIPIAFLSFVVTDILNKSLTGTVIGEILRNRLNIPVFRDDAERLTWLREKFLADGERYLAEDFSQLQGDEKIVKLKKEILRQSIRGLNNESDLARALDNGIKILKPYLEKAATNLRRLGAYPPSVFLMGLVGLDSPDVINRLAESLKGLKVAKSDD